MIKNSSLSQLKAKKNLLAFSAGGDSTALLFLLKENNIKFDIAIVDYGLREQSIQEVQYAQTLAKENDFICYLHVADKITKNFESAAREIRYNFFNKIIKENNYDNLLTAHHLGDRFEWMLMQFCKGSGCVELAGMQEIENRQNHTLVRPLLHVEKSELLDYLQTNNIQYFEDKTNLDESIKRSSFRHQHSKPLLKKYMSGIKKSFEYLDEDKKILLEDVKIITIGDFSYFENTHNIRANIFAIDKYLKQNNYLISASERELLKSEKTVIVGRKFIVNQEDNYIFILLHVEDKIVLPKKFKEECRVLKIEPKLRTYMYRNNKTFLHVKELLRSI